MKIYTEKELRYFNFWGGAKANAEMLSFEQLDELEEVLEQFEDTNWSDTKINDLMWFDFEWVCEAIGLKYDSENNIIIQ